MRVPEPNTGKTTRLSRLEIDIANIGLEGQKIKHPFARIESHAGDAIGIDSAGPCVTTVVVMGIVGKEPGEGNRVKLDLFISSQSRIEHADEITVVASPPQAILRIRLSASHAAAESADTTRLSWDVVIRNRVRFGVDAPNI